MSLETRRSGKTQATLASEAIVEEEGRYVIVLLTPEKT